MTRYLPLAVWGAIVAGTMAVPPVLERYSGGAGTAAMLRVAVAIVSGAIALAFATRQPRRGLGWFAAVALVAGLACGAAYWRIRSVASAPFEQTRIVIGDLRSDPEGQAALAACCSIPSVNPAAGCRSGEGLLWCASGEPARFFTPESLSRNWWLLAILYLASAGFLTATMAGGAGLLWREPARPAPIRVFISYSRRDEAHRAALASHLRNFERIGFVESWFDGEIPAGADWERQIAANLDSADVVLLLVSAPFLESAYCGLECKHALEGHAAGRITVVPVLVGECDWQAAPFARLQVIPRSGGPVCAWSDTAAAWHHVMDELVKLLERRAAGPKSAARGR